MRFILKDQKEMGRSHWSELCSYSKEEMSKKVFLSRRLSEYVYERRVSLPGNPFFSVGRTFHDIKDRVEETEWMFSSFLFHNDF